MIPLAASLLVLLAVQPEATSGQPTPIQLTPLAPSVAAPSEPGVGVGELFVNSNVAYESGDYAQAIELYEELVTRGVEPGHLYFNLGNAYLRNGELGRAVAAYRRCQALRPRDGDVLANLMFARQSTKDAIAPPEPSPVLRTLFFWHYGLSRSELVRTTVVLNLLLWGVLAWRLFSQGSEVLRWVTIVLLLLLVACGGSLLLRLAMPARIAIVIPQEIEAHSGTSAETVVRFLLHAGTELRAVDTREGWIRIALPDGQQGWIEASHTELVAQ